MKWSNTPTIRMTLLAYVFAVTLIGLYCLGSPYPNSYAGHFFQTDLTGQNNQVSLKTNHAKNLQSLGASSSDTVVCNLHSLSNQCIHHNFSYFLLIDVENDQVIVTYNDTKTLANPKGF